MSKYKVRSTPKADKLTAEDKAQEQKFIKVAIIVTLVVILLIYLVFQYM
ncbi:MAG: hypothetical protein R2774_06010 [Saprospiraceae bacterium]